MTSRLRSFVTLTRPVFLGGGFVLYGLGAALARTQGARLSLPRYLLGQLLVTSVQLATQYSNEHFDFDTDRHPEGDRTWFSGGSGALSDGTLPPRIALRAAVVAAGVAGAAIVAVTFLDRRVTLVGAIALALGWFYSAPPLRLVATAAGELLASLEVAALVPLVGLWLNGGRVDGELPLIVAPLVLLHIAMLIAFQLPDEAADRATGKRTLTVRIGRQRASWVHAAMVLGAAPFLLGSAAIADIAGSRVPWGIALAALAGWQVLSLIVAPVRSLGGYRWVTVRAVGLFVGVTALQLASTL